MLPNALTSLKATNPSIEENNTRFSKFFHDNILNHQFDDLERAQNYLRKQESWLRYVVIGPGAIVDVEEAANKRSEVDLIQDQHVTSTISYSRLGYAMFQAGEESSDKYNNKYLSPIPNTKVKTSFKDYESARGVIGDYFKNQVLPVVYWTTFIGMIGAALGYYVRMVEQGNWVYQRLGLKLG